MFLKSLTLKGFKSFAEATTLEFEPGITVVVGPNGSGKSNVVDAIGWVLGAQAPSAVRSQKMDDVIFAGTTNRPALGRAEVTLTIDNNQGLLPIDFTEVSVTRTLFRTGDSEYAINGVPCRLLDIQDLLSDTGVGRQQHVLVSQGQIDGVLNARPEDRRLVIEEAAGVLKYRKRKEKAERRLNATEANLTRLNDLLREVRRQLRPLERQADAARRHGDLVAELVALRIHVAGRDLATLRNRLDAGERRMAELNGEETALRGGLAQLDAAVLAAEARLTSLGGHDLGDALGRYEALRERARGLAAVLTERRRGVERDRAVSVDRAMIASLEAEAARMTEELAAVEIDASALGPDAEALRAAEASLAEERAVFEQQWSDAVALPSGQAAEARGELAALRAGVEREESEIARQRVRLAALEAKANRLDAERASGEQQRAEAEAAETPLVAAMADAEAERAGADSVLAETQAALIANDADRHTWTARAEALAMALDEARSRAGAEALGAIDGVLGTLLDLVAVDDGWEAAFEAAAGEALAAVVVADIGAARRALTELHRGELRGAVLTLGTRRPVPLFPSGAEPLRTHVRAADPAVDDLLDTLIGAALVVEGEWEAALDLHLVNPDAVIVTRQGDRFGTTGWRVGGPGTGATRVALEEAKRRATEATDAASAAAASVISARSAVDVARSRESALSRQLDSNDAKASAITDALHRIGSEHRDTTIEADALREHIGELAERVARDSARVTSLTASLPELESAEADLLARGRAAGDARGRLEEHAAAVGALRTDLEVRAAGLDERRQFLRRRLTELEERLERDEVERREAETRRLELDDTQRALERLSTVVNERSRTVEASLATLHERRRRQSEQVRSVGSDLDGLRRQRAADERSLEEVRERGRRAELDNTEVRLRVETAVETMRHDLDCEPAAAMASPCPPLPEGVTAPARVRELERELRIMGPVNPLALEEFEALQERCNFLDAQLEDVKASRRELAKVIKAVDVEIVNVFAAAFADVSQNFEALFETLFPGGRGRLSLTDPDNLLETGIEVEAKPSGKNIRKLSLLSGGERSLTALAFLLAVFRSRPSPFYVMDEVEAALDDVNLHRFLDLIHEFREEAQLIIVSHQKRTMEAADSLYGVTMQPGGSSKVVSERVAVQA